MVHIIVVSVIFGKMILLIIVKNVMFAYKIMIIIVYFLESVLVVGTSSHFGDLSE